MVGRAVVGGAVVDDNAVWCCGIGVVVSGAVVGSAVVCCVALGNPTSRVQRRWIGVHVSMWPGCLGHRVTQCKVLAVEEVKSTASPQDQASESIKPLAPSSHSKPIYFSRNPSTSPFATHLTQLEVVANFQAQYTPLAAVPSPEPKEPAVPISTFLRLALQSQPVIAAAYSTAVSMYTSKQDCE